MVVDARSSAATQARPGTAATARQALQRPSPAAWPVQRRFVRGVAAAAAAAPEPSSSSSSTVVIRAPPPPPPPQPAAPEAGPSEAASIEQQPEWEAAVSMVEGLGFQRPQAEMAVAKAFGWKGQAFWRHQKVEEEPSIDQISAALAFLGALGLSQADITKVVKTCPEVRPAAPVTAGMPRADARWRQQRPAQRSGAVVAARAQHPRAPPRPACRCWAATLRANCRRRWTSCRRTGSCRARCWPRRCCASRRCWATTWTARAAAWEVRDALQQALPRGDQTALAPDS